MLTSRNSSRLLPECWVGVKVLFPDCGVHVPGVLDWAWTDLRADLLSRYNLVSASGTLTALPSCSTKQGRKCVSKDSDAHIQKFWFSSSLSNHDRWFPHLKRSLRFFQVKSSPAGGHLVLQNYFIPGIGHLTKSVNHS